MSGDRINRSQILGVFARHPFATRVDAYGVMFWSYDGVPLPAGSLGQVAHVVQSNRWLRHDGERWVPANDWPPPHAD
jgi:hypothetical protein